MFSVYLNQLSNSNMRMQEIVRAWDGHIQEIDHIIATLASFSGMDAVIRKLIKKRNELEFEKQKIILLVQASDKIHMLYDGCETTIVNNAEGAALTGKKVAYSLNRDVFNREDIWTLPKIKI